MNTTNETTERLNTILEAVEKPLAEDLVNQFLLRNPLDFAKLLVTLDLPDAIKAQLLALKVGMKPAYNGESLEILIERAALQMWNRLAEDCSKV